MGGVIASKGTRVAALAVLLIGLSGLVSLAGSKPPRHLDSRLPHADAEAAALKAEAKPKPEGKKPERSEEKRYLPLAGGDGESEVVKGQTAWRWHLLTFPTGKIPDQPFTKAAKWVEKHVPRAEPWPFAQDGLLRGSPGESITPIPTGNWLKLGPKPMDMTTQYSGYIYGKVTGRFNAVAADPRTVNNPGAIKAFAGGASGGFWESTNCCNSNTTWTSVWDSTPYVTQAVGAIEIDPTNPDVIYVGTGDFDASDQFGEGILKSTDGGATWAQYATDVFSPYAPGTPLWGSQNTGVVKVDPNNPQNVLVGTRFDLYISHDGGQTWVRCPFGANPTDPTGTTINGAINRICGIVLDSTTNPTTAYISVGYYSASYNGNNGVYRCTIPNSGAPSSFTLLNNGWPTGTGNGTNGATNIGWIKLGSSRGNTGGTLTIYAQVHNVSTDGQLGTWVTTNGGATWAQIDGATSTETQDWYDLFITADPQNDKTLYVGRINLYKDVVNSTYSSVTKTNLSNVYSMGSPGYGTLHPDQHGACWISGTGASTQFLVGNDGGLYLANGTVGGFTQLNDTVNATQWYAGQIGANFAGGATQYLFAGSQDNGSASWDSSQAGLTWQARSTGGDGFFASFDPIAGTLGAGNWFTEYVYGALERSTTGASGAFNTINWEAGTHKNPDRPAWSTPFLLDTFHCTTASCPNFFIASQWFYASTNGGGTVTRTSTTDLAVNGTAGTGSVITFDIGRSDPKAAVTGSDQGAIWWSPDVLSGTNCTQAAANGSSFACTVNTAATWTNLTQSNAVLPKRSILGVAFDPTTTYRVYAAVGGFDENTPATPGHVFVCVNSSGTWTWTNKSGNLPNVPAESIVINPNNPAQAFLGTDYGFYYTDNINAAPPVWFLYDYGLPTTIIRYLTLDRGPSATPYNSTTLAAFTYGRGTYAIRIPASGGFLPYPVRTTMTANKNGSLVDITYPLACTNVQHNAYWGSLGDYSTVTGGACQLGGTGTASGVGIPDNSWFVITGASDGTSSPSVIASFGKDSAGYERNLAGWQSVTGCSAYTQQDEQTQCP